MNESISRFFIRAMLVSLSLSLRYYFIYEFIIKNVSFHLNEK